MLEVFIGICGYVFCGYMGGTEGLGFFFLYLVFGLLIYVDFEFLRELLFLFRICFLLYIYIYFGFWFRYYFWCFFNGC